MRIPSGGPLVAALSALLILAACAPAAAPSPAAAPAKPTAEQPAARAASTAAPAKPAAEQAAQKPAAKAAFDEQAVAEFYKGKTFKIVVGFSPGGGFDTYARAIAKHIGKHIPGNPTVIVENMPGAGSMLSANNLYNTLPKDGTVIGHFIGGVLLQQYLGNEGAQYDASKFTYLGAPTPDSGVCAVRKDAGFSDLAALRDASDPLILGGTAPGSNTDDIPIVLKESLGLNIRLVAGYKGTADIRLAADRGEVQGGCWGWESMSVTWTDALNSGDVIPIGQAGDQPHPDLPKVPMFRDVATTDEQRQMVKFGIDAPAVFNRPFVAPPGVPADRVAALRQAFAKTMQDPEFLADAEKAKLAVAPISGERIEELIKELFAMPPDIKTKLQGILLAKS